MILTLNKYLAGLIFLLTIFGCSESNTQITRIYNDVLLAALQKYDIQTLNDSSYFLLEDSSFIPTGYYLDEIKITMNKYPESDTKHQLIKSFISDSTQVFIDVSKIQSISLKTKQIDNSNLIGVLKLSKVYFNSNKGLFYYEFVCGGECGSGNLVFVQFVGDSWKIDEQIQIFVY